MTRLCKTYMDIRSFDSKPKMLNRNIMWLFQAKLFSQCFMELG